MFETQEGQYDRYSLGMGYNALHNIIN